jgi:tRNA(Ile)-lysidine synthase
MRDRANEPVSEAEAAALLGALTELPALVLAVSGGPDSTALLWLAARWRAQRKRGPTLIAVTIDHGLRAASAHEALAVKRLAKTLKVAHRTLRWTGRKPKTGIQEAARAARYRLLCQAARKAGARHILTAHTLDDQAETVLFRMARGSGVSGLAGMGFAAGVPVEEGRGIALVRPLLSISKTRLIATLHAAKVAYSADPSNADPRFARPRLRALLPALAREGLTAERLGRLARRVARIDAVLLRTVDAVQAVLCPEPWPPQGPVAVDPERFLALPAEIGLRLMARMIAQVGNEGSAELGQLETLHAELVAAAGPPGAPPARLRRTLAGALITLATGKLTVERAPPRRSGATRRGSGAKRRGSGATPRGSGAKTGTSGRKRTFTNRGSNDAE